MIIESHLTNFFVYIVETLYADRAKSYNVTFYLLSKLAAKYNRDLSIYEIEKSKRDTYAFDGGKCVSNALDFLLKFKGEERKVKKNCCI